MLSRFAVRSQLVDSARQLLSDDDIAATDNFFALGGDSLLAVEYLSRIEDQFGIYLDLTHIFESESFDELSSRATQRPEFADQADVVRTTLFDGPGFAPFRCATSDDYLQLAGAVGTIKHHRDSEPSGITRVEAKYPPGTIGMLGLTNGPLVPHTDSPGDTVVPRVLMLWCETNEADGGASLVTSATDVLNHLEEVSPDAHAAFIRDPCALFRSGSNFWQGPVFEPNKDGTTSVRLRFDELGYFVAPAVAHVEQLRRSISECVARFQLAPGEGYAVRNDLWLHGREPFEGSRLMLRIFVE